MPVWRLGDGEHLKGLAEKISFLRHYPQTELFYFFFLPPFFSLLPSSLSSLLPSPHVSVPFCLHRLEATGTDYIQNCPQSVFQGMWSVEHKLNLKGQGTGIRQDQESPALVTTDHASVRLQNQMLLGISLVPWWLSPSTPHCSEAYPCSRSLVLLETVRWLELEFQTPNSDQLAAWSCMSYCPDLQQGSMKVSVVSFQSSCF